MPMVIENNTSDPVDYDVGVEGDGNIMTQGDKSAFQCPTQPKIKVPTSPNYTYELSEAGVSLRHIFLITPVLGHQTMIIVPNATESQDTVKLEETTVGGKKYYRVNLA